MADKVKPLKIESSSTGGTQNDGFPTEVNPSQDYLASKGIAFENNDNRTIDLDGSGNIQFIDATETVAKTVRQLRTASENIFTAVDDITDTNVQDAIRKANTFGSYWQTTSDSGETSTTSTTVWSTKLTLTTPSLPSGDYILNFTFVWRAANANRTLDGRVRDGSTDLLTFRPFTPSTSEQAVASGFIFLSSVSGVKTYTLEFKVFTTATTVYMRNAVFGFWRVE